MSEKPLSTELKIPLKRRPDHQVILNINNALNWRQKTMNTPKDSTGGCCPPPPCSALAGTFDIEAIEQAFFNHDHDGSEPAPGQWEKRRDQWWSFKTYLAAHPRQEISGRDAYKDEMPNSFVERTSC